MYFKKNPILHHVCNFCLTLNPLPNNKILDVTKSKPFAEDKLNVATKKISLSLSKKHCRIWVKCWFSPFPTVLSKAFFFEVNKKSGLCGIELIAQSRLLTTPKGKASENINQHSLLFPQCFLPFPEQISNYFVVYKNFQFGPV